MDQTITIHLDLTGLSGYLAIRPTFELIDELGLRVRWLPISGLLNRVSAKQPDAGMIDPLAAYKARRQEARDRFAGQEFARNCQHLGISETQGKNTFDATWVHVGLLFLNHIGIDPRAYIEGVYHAGFNLERPLHKVGSVCELLQFLGIDIDGFKNYLMIGKKALEELQQRLLEEGIFDSPAYLYDGQRFHGRQHLPLIRWYLTGREDLPPV